MYIWLPLSGHLLSKILQYFCTVADIILCLSGIAVVPFRKAPANGSASISHCDLSYIEIYDEVMELGPLDGDIFPGEVIKQIHMDSFTGGDCGGWKR